MAVSLEARAPLLDHKLIDFVTRIPASLKMARGETKHILKRAVANLVPTEILNRPKQGFGIPVQEWINQQLREPMREVLTEPRTRQRGYLNPKYLNVLLDEHERGRRDHSTGLWALFMLELWQRRRGRRPDVSRIGARSGEPSQDSRGTDRFRAGLFRQADGPDRLIGRLQRFLCLFGTRLQLGIGFLRLLDALLCEGADLVGSLGGVEARELDAAQNVGGLLGALGHFPVLVISGLTKPSR